MKNKIHTFIPILLGVFILLPFKIKPFLIAVFLIYAVVFRAKTIDTSDWKKVFIFSLLFISYTISFLYTDNYKRGLDYWIRNLPLLIVPICFILLPLERRTNVWKWFKKSFIVSVSIYNVLIFIYLYRLGFFAGEHDINYCYSYITNEFGGINEHPIYISVQFVVALFFIYSGSLGKKWGAILFIPLVIGLFMLSRKGVISAFILLSILYLLKNYSRKVVIGFVVVSAVVLSISMFYIDHIRERYLEVFQKEQIVNNARTSTGIRYILWQNATTVIKGSPWIGYGIGDAQDAFSEKIRVLGYEELYNKRTNCHNQYLQVWITTGVVGLLLFLYTLVYFGVFLYNRSDKTGFLLLLLFIWVFVFESFLDRQNGIILYSFILWGYIATPLTIKRLPERI